MAENIDTSIAWGAPNRELFLNFIPIADVRKAIAMLHEFQEEALTLQADRHARELAAIRNRAFRYRRQRNVLVSIVASMIVNSYLIARKRADERHEAYRVNPERM